MLKLMRFYLLHKDWRARLALNSAASNIWLCWLITLMFVAGFVFSVVFKGLDTVTALVMTFLAIVSLLLFFILFTQAKRLHASVTSIYPKQ